jgi:hypothetical protein
MFGEFRVSRDRIRRMLLFRGVESQHSALQVFKPSTTEILCEDITKLFFRRNVLESNSPLFTFLLNPKICHLEMLCPGNGCQIFGYVYSSVTVTKEW